MPGATSVVQDAGTLLTLDFDQAHATGPKACSVSVAQSWNRTAGGALPHHRSASWHGDLGAINEQRDGLSVRSRRSMVVGMQCVHD
jgi:hypothetical protein